MLLFQPLLSIDDALCVTVPCCAVPEPHIFTQINYGANKGKAYTEEEDRFIICSIAKLGYGAWDDLKADIRKSWKFRWAAARRACERCCS
jgi:hypothetical protein